MVDKLIFIFWGSIKFMDKLKIIIFIIYNYNKGLAYRIENIFSTI